MKWLWLFVAVLLGGLPASAKSVGTQYGDQTARPGEGIIEAAPGDPIFSPTQAQIQGWVNDGINAALQDVGLLDIPGVAAWTALFPSGIPCWTGSVRFAIAGTPQLTATVAGWSTAWNQEMYQRILVDQNAVSGLIAAALVRHTWNREVDFLIGIARDDIWAPIDARAMIWAWNEWRTVGLTPRGTVSLVADDSSPGAAADSSWAPRYVLAWSMYDAALAAPESIAVVRGQFLRRQQMAPDAGLTELVDVPSSGWRLVVGRPQEYAYIDF